MCGIVGGVCLLGDPSGLRPWLTKAVSLLKPRGPESDGQFFEAQLALGATRLRIFDVSEEADQPYRSEDGRYTMVFNGAILNFKELKRALEGEGISFRTNSDTEVALAAIVKWGVKRALLEFEGMFAIALYDAFEKRLLLCRDKFGIKPLFYHHNDRFFGFSSEIKPLLAHPSVPRQVESSVVPEFFAFQTVMPPYTMFRDIFALTPGALMEVDVEAGRVVGHSRYWKPEDEAGLGAANVDDLADAVTHSLRIAWRSDRDAGLQLSGGVDSSLLLALSYARLRRDSVQNFSVVFDESRNHFANARSEEPYIRRAAETFGAPVDCVEFPESDISDALPEAIWRHEAPLYSANSVLQMLHAKHLRDRVQVLIGGEGADDVFLGYFDGVALDGSADQALKRYLGSEELTRLFGEGGASQATARRMELLTGERLRGLSASQRATVLTVETVLHGLLARHDRMFMGHGIEGRPPYCTASLLRVRFGLPDAAVHDGRIGKVALKEVARRYFPDDFVYRKKQWLSGQVADWCAQDRIWGKYIRGAAASAVAHLLNPEIVERTRELPDDATKWSGKKLALQFAFTNFSLWHEIFIENDPTSSGVMHKFI
ncbi:MAG: asparagine synthase (glutamine-hydrolyzing) [Marivibrio sp.]|uniref:asparagine synthase (glutamine-hydrolyzing) n=1 Tax=Marivibrio sp. TaxID=2039719 RepID=UPI0032EC18D7